jgi:hypothetical protein
LSPLLLVVLGLIAAALVALVIFAVAWFLQPARALRAAMAGLIGGTIGFTITALVQAPFYMKATMPITPFVVSFLTCAGLAVLAAVMILRAPSR